VIDVVQQINAVTRRVGAHRVEGGESRTVTISQTYDADVEDLWDACTNPERIPRWFLPVTGDLEVGGKYQLEGNAGGTIQECEPPRRLAVTWEFGDTVSWVEVTLTAEAGDRTRFELAHTLDVDDQWNSYGPGAVGVGWDLAVSGLRLHLVSGEAVDSDEFMAWSASDEGKQFATQASESWRHANVEGGAGVAEARAQADATTTAYTVGEDPA
jgi:uncharacterized protein YndB with AHSA1/START domain